MPAAQNTLLFGLALAGWLLLGGSAMRNNALHGPAVHVSLPSEVGSLMSTLRERVVDLSGPPATARIVLIGNIDTGKSTLCQWLLAKTDVCKVWNDFSEHTTEMELATGHWFNDPALGALEVLDTPGFQLTEADGAAWVHFTTKVREEMKEIDAVILLANPNGEAGAFTEGSLNKIRQSFGSDIWENIVNFVPVRTKWRRDDLGKHHGLLEETWNKHLANYKAKFEEVEFAEATNKIDWNAPTNAEAKTLLEAEIQAVGFYGAFLVTTPTFWPMVSAHNPDFNVSGFSCGPPDYCGEDPLETWLAITKLTELDAMRTFILDKRVARLAGSDETDEINPNGLWDVQHLRPRFGPSEVTANQTFSCKWPHDCRLDIAGTYLTDADIVGIFPGGHTCGTESAGFVAPLEPPAEHNFARTKLADPVSETLKSFLVGTTTQLTSFDPTPYKVCYCAFGYCTHPARFFRDVGTVTVENTKCQVPCENETEYNAQLRVGTPCGDEAYILARGNVTYQCAHGHGIMGNHSQDAFERGCDMEGNFDEMQQCPRVQCPDEPVVPGNSVRATIMNGQIHQWQDPVYFQCNSGHTFNGDSKGSPRVDVVCGATGQWEMSSTMQASMTLEKFLEDGGCKWVVPWVTIGVGSTVGVLGALWVYFEFFRSEGAAAASLLQTHATSAAHSLLQMANSSHPAISSYVQALNSTFAGA